MNVALELLLGTVTEAGTVTEVLLEVRATTVPPWGAAANKVTVPVLDAPPTTDVGFRVTDLTVPGLTVRTAELVVFE